MATSRLRQERFIGADVGFFLDWQVDPETKLPSNCSAFDRNRGETAKETMEKFGSVKSLGEAGCPKQMLKDKQSGKALYELVEQFASDQETWISAYTEAFIKMQANGYAAGKLVVGPTGFWEKATIDGKRV